MSNIIITKALQIGVQGFGFTQWYIFTNNTLAEVTTAGFLNDSEIIMPAFTGRDFAWVATSNAGTVPVQINVADGVVTLAAFDMASIVLTGDPSNGLTVTENSPGNWSIDLSQNLSSTGSPTFSTVSLTALSGFSNATYALPLVNTSAGTFSYLTPSASTPRYLSNDSLGSPKWDTVDIAGGGITGVLPIANGGTNSSAALANGLIMVSSGGKIVEVGADSSMGGFKITNLADPTQLQDAVTKNYADALLYNFSVKASCNLATAAALPTCTYNNGVSGVGATLTATANGALTVDSVLTVVGNRILVKNQVTTANNGIYVVTTVGDGSNPFVLTRAQDFDKVSEMPIGASTYISAGTVNTGSTWALNSVVVTVGVSAVTFAQVGGAAAVTILGTTNQINVGLVGSTYTLSTPQDIATGSTPTFLGLILSGLSVSSAVATDGSKNLVSVTNTGSGNNVLATSPTLVTPILGTPTSGNLVNCTGYTAANIAGLGTGVGTWLVTPSSANLAAAVTDETGSGALVFANTPTLVTPVIGAATGTSVNLSGVATAASVTTTGSANTQKQFTANSGASITINPSNGAYQTITLTANTTITLSAVPSSTTEQEFILELVQDGTGGRTVTWSNITFATNNGALPPINTATGSSTYIGISGTSSAWIGYPVNQGLGVSDGSNASAGYVGEVISSSIAIGSAAAMTTATALSITSITLTAGDWMVSGNLGFIAASGTLPTVLTASISATNNTQATSPNGGAFAQLSLPFTASSTNVLVLAPTRINITSTTTYYLVGTATFTVSTLTGYGSIMARRFR